MNWKGYRRKQSSYNLRSVAALPTGARENDRDLSQFLGCDLSPVFPENVAGMLSTEPLRYVEMEFMSSFFVMVCSVEFQRWDYRTCK